MQIETGTGERGEVRLRGTESCRLESYNMGEIYDLTAKTLVRFPDTNPGSFETKQVIVENLT